MILKMDPRKGFEFFEEAQKKKQDEMLFIRWVHGYQSEMNFNEFKSKVIEVHEISSRPEKEMTEAEIYEKVKDILRKE